MSEFSDSVHVIRGEVDAAVATLSSLGATALVLPKVGSHVTVLVGPSLIRRWSAISEQPLLSWGFAADHALEVALFDAGKRVAAVTLDADRSERKLIGARAWQMLTGVDPARLERALDSSAELAAGAELIAEMLELSDFQWLSSRDLDDGDGVRELRAEYPRAVYLRAGKRARWTTAAEIDTFEREKSEWEAVAREVVTGAPLLAPPTPPLRRGTSKKAHPPWCIRGAGMITLEIENYGGEARGVIVEIESPLIVAGACCIARVELDDVELAGTLWTGGWRASEPTILWPAASNPATPTPSKTRRLTITFQASASDRGQLFVRVVPGASADGRGRFVVGRMLEVTV